MLKYLLLTQCLRANALLASQIKEGQEITGQKNLTYQELINGVTNEEIQQQIGKKISTPNGEIEISIKAATQYQECLSLLPPKQSRRQLQIPSLPGIRVGSIYYLYVSPNLLFLMA